MKKFSHLRKRVLIIVSGFLFVFVLSICVFAVLHPKEFWDEIVAGGRPQQNPFDDPPLEYQYYQIDPLIIITDIANGKNDVFHLLEKEPDSFKDVYSSGTFSWSQEDYLTIAKAHHLYLTGEAVKNGWKIYSYGNFVISKCRDDMNGFDRANIIFYKETPGEFLVTYILIRPLKGLIESSFLAYERRPFADGFSEAKVMNERTTADNALKIAEKMGGKARCQELSNNGCIVRVTYFGDEYWRVGYSWDNADFDIKISAFDGSYKVLSR